MQGVIAKWTNLKQDFFVFRSFVFTFVCARVHKETIAPVNTLYRFGEKTIFVRIFTTEISIRASRDLGALSTWWMSILELRDTYLRNCGSTFSLENNFCGKSKSQHLCVIGSSGSQTWPPPPFRTPNIPPLHIPVCDGDSIWLKLRCELWSYWVQTSY